MLILVSNVSVEFSPDTLQICSELSAGIVRLKCVLCAGLNVGFEI